MQPKNIPVAAVKAQYSLITITEQNTFFSGKGLMKT